MALTEVAICDMALANIGINEPITDVDGTLSGSTDTRITKRTCATWYPRRRDQLLQRLHWPFARKYATLVLNDNGDDEVWEDEWDFAYDLPSDCLRVWRFVNTLGAQGYAYGPSVAGNIYDPYINSSDGHYPYNFVIRHHDSGTVMLTNVPAADAKIEYTAQITDASLYPEYFGRALAWAVAESIAMPLTGSSEKYGIARAEAEIEFRRAAALLLNEQEPYPEGDGEFIATRGA